MPIILISFINHLCKILQEKISILKETLSSHRQ